MCILPAICSAVLPATMESIAFQMLSLVVLGIFCWMIYYYRSQTTQCLKEMVSFTSGMGAGAGNKRLYDGFLVVAMALGALATGIAVTKIAMSGFGAADAMITEESIIASGRGRWMSQWGPAIIAVAVALATSGITALEVWVLKAIGSLTRSSKFTAAIIQTKKNLLAAASMFIVPLALVWTGVNPTRDVIITYIFAIEIITLTSVFVIHTLRGFIKQKVSLLVWFLYLCTVEIFPVCAAVLAVTKNI